MTTLILDSHILAKNAENVIFKANNKNEYLIDSNSSVTNIDVLREYFNYNRTSEKRILNPA
jgi:hypothetical protein